MIDKFTIKELLAFIIIMLSFKTAMTIIILNTLKNNYEKLNSKIEQALKDHVSIYKAINQEQQ